MRIEGEKVMAWGLEELFVIASKAEIERTKFLLGKYTSMVALMEDFEKFEKDLQQVAIDGEAARRIDQDDLHADKTANAVILIEKQRWVYEQYRFYTHQLRRAFSLIKEDEERKAIEYRYMKGNSFKATLLHFRHSLSESTIRRKLAEGTANMAHTLKLIGFFEHNETF